MTTHLTLLSILLLAASASAQDRPHAVTFELGGPGGAYSIGYERSVAPNMHVRAAVGYYYILTAAPVSVFWTPEVGVGRLRPELGVGVVVGLSRGPGMYQWTSSGEIELHALPKASLGLRAGVAGVELRAGATALYGRIQTSERRLGLTPHLGLSARF